MPKEQLPHIPRTPTTPEQILKEKGPVEIRDQQPLNPEQVKAAVEELAELSTARAEAYKHLRGAWANLTKKEREDLQKLREKKGKQKLEEKDKEALAHFESTLAAAQIDPELIEFQEGAVGGYDNRIQELSSHPEVLAAYKTHFEKAKQTLARVVAFEHLQKEFEALQNTEQKLQRLYEKVGRTPGPVERRKLTEIAERKQELGKHIETFELDSETVDMLRRREVRRMQQSLERYSFAETESRTELIREVLPDLMQGAPVLFQGETGSGKSQLAKYISERYLRKKPVVISISEQIKESQIMGARGLEAGQTIFNYSEFINAQKEGNPVVLDEVNLMPHEFAGLLHDLLQKRVGDTWRHPVTGEEIPITAPIMATANLKSERYKQRYELDVATLRRFIGGAGAREIHYLDLGKKDREGKLIAPETLKILAVVLSDRNGEIQWDEAEAPGKLDELKRFAGACRKIQEDFTLSIREGAEQSLARGDRLAFQELVITLKDQIEIMKSWKAQGFQEPLEQVVLREFFRKAEISGRAVKDRENMVKVFMASKFFQETEPDKFHIQGLSAQTVRQWQGKG